MYLSVKVIPNASKTELREVLSDGVQKIAVSAPPEKGKANEELLRFFKKELGRNVKIVGGETSRKKLLFVSE